MSQPKSILQQLIEMDPLDVISLFLSWEENTPAENFDNFSDEDRAVLDCVVGDLTQIEEAHTDTEGDA